MTIIALTTVNNLNDAKEIAHNLLTNELAVEVSISTKYNAITFVDGELVEQEEYNLLIKSSQDLFVKIHETITQLNKPGNHGVINLKMAQCSPQYVDWVCRFE